MRICLPRQFEERLANSVQAFSTAVELRFPVHAGHSDQIAELAAAMGREMGLSKKAIRDLKMAVRLRDLGLCEVPYNLVNGKHHSEWTQAEADTYFRHAEISGAMLDLVPSLRHLANTVRYHHLSYQGGSSPRMPSKEAIPTSARILKVATEYVWLLREYGEERARETLKSMRGTEFCPRAHDALFRVLPSWSGAGGPSAIFPKDPARGDSAGALRSSIPTAADRDRMGSEERAASTQLPSR